MHNSHPNTPLSNKPWQHWQQKILPKNPFTLLISIALFLVLTANIGFFRQALIEYPFSQNGIFILSLALVLFGVLLLILTLICYRWTLKISTILLIWIAVICAYFTDTYGTIYDTNMLQNALQTDRAETQDLLNIWLFLRLIFLAILPSFLILKSPLIWQKWQSTLKQRLLTLGLALACIILPIISQSGQYASFFREHKSLRMYTNPTTPIYALSKLLGNEYQKARQPKETIMHALDAKKSTAHHKPNLAIFVVGETARADHVSFNGYERQTFPKLAQQTGLINFSQTTACGTSTAYVVPCLFAYANANDYDVDLAPFHENVLETLQRTGVFVLWRDNNSNSKTVMDRLPLDQYQDYKSPQNNPICDPTADNECRDLGMLAGLDEVLAQHPNQDVLIVLHQMGNHGPAYDKRYNAEYRQFTPVCTTNELAQCEHQSLINAFDNALLATDDFLNQSINWLKNKQDQYQVNFLYVSDHGESLGENGIYLHGMPKKIAPKEQRHVPMFFWSPQTQAKADPANPVKTIDTPTTQDVITPSLLQMFDIQTQATQGQTSIFDLIGITPNYDPKDP